MPQARARRKPPRGCSAHRTTLNPPTTRSHCHARRRFQVSGRGLEADGNGGSGQTEPRPLPSSHTPQPPPPARRTPPRSAPGAHRAAAPTPVRSARPDLPEPRPGRHQPPATRTRRPAPAPLRSPQRRNPPADSGHQPLTVAPRPPLPTGLFPESGIRETEGRNADFTADAVDVSRTPFSCPDRLAYATAGLPPWACCSRPTGSSGPPASATPTGATRQLSAACRVAITSRRHPKSSGIASRHLGHGFGRCSGERGGQPPARAKARAGLSYGAQRALGSCPCLVDATHSGPAARC